MSTEEDSEFCITASADDILEVSPVNSYARQYASPNSNGITNGNLSPTDSQRNRRSNNRYAFSSSSESSEDEKIDGSDEEEVGNRSSGSSTSSSGEDDEEEENNDRSRPSGQGKNPPQHQSTRQQKQQQQQQSEFDKALLSGVPSRGYASSFFSADSTDASDAPHPSDAILSEGGPSWDAADTQTEISVPPPVRHVKNRQQQQAQNSSSSKDASSIASNSKERKHHHRVNITTTTQQQPSSSGSVHSAAVFPSKDKNNAIEAQSSPILGAATSSSSSAAAATSASGAYNNTTNPPPPTSNRSNATSSSQSTTSLSAAAATGGIPGQPLHPPPNAAAAASDQDFSAGVLPDVLMSMRQKIESMQFFDSDMMRLVAADSRNMDEYDRESLKRSSQQSISAAVLVSLAHKRYERRRLAAMEIEKVVRGLVVQNELERVRAILLLLSDDYVRSTSEDARKGGVVALAACAIGLKKAHDDVETVMECRDLILASVVHACQDHSQRVRYYATESLFNVVKVIPGLAVQHFFILFEILRSLYADVDVDVRSGAELLDKKLKEVIVGAMNSGSFSTEACVPVFARFVYMKNKATKRLTLTWLQELNEKLIGAPILEFLHLFLGGIFDMVADPALAIRQSALAFLQSVLPKLLVINSEAIADMDDSGMRVDFDKILQSLVTTMEHPDPFVRKVAMFWMAR